MAVVLPLVVVPDVVVPEPDEGAPAVTIEMELIGYSAEAPETINCGTPPPETADVFVTPVVLVVPVVLASAGEGPLPSTDFVIEEIFMELRRRLADEARFQPPRPG